MYLTMPAGTGSGNPLRGALAMMQEAAQKFALVEEVALAPAVAPLPPPMPLCPPMSPCAPSLLGISRGGALWRGVLS